MSLLVKVELEQLNRTAGAVDNERIARLSRLDPRGRLKDVAVFPFEFELDDVRVSFRQIVKLHKPGCHGRNIASRVSFRALKFSWLTIDSCPFDTFNVEQVASAAVVEIKDEMADALRAFASADFVGPYGSVLGDLDGIVRGANGIVGRFIRCFFLLLELPRRRHDLCCPFFALKSEWVSN
jgi:hypothetical protein